jgi:hypothetical protein
MREVLGRDLLVRFATAQIIFGGLIGRLCRGPKRR